MQPTVEISALSELTGLLPLLPVRLELDRSLKQANILSWLTSKWVIWTKAENCKNSYYENRLMTIELLGSLSSLAFFVSSCFNLLHIYFLSIRICFFFLYVSTAVTVMVVPKHCTYFHLQLRLRICFPVLPSRAVIFNLIYSLLVPTTNEY